jgi:hypothetical protein
MQTAPSVHGDLGRLIFGAGTLLCPAGANARSSALDPRTLSRAKGIKPGGKPAMAKMGNCDNGLSLPGV